MTGLLIIGGFVILLGLLAARFGVDSRDGRDWREDPDRRVETEERRSGFPAFVGQL